MVTQQNWSVRSAKGKSGLVWTYRNHTAELTNSPEPNTFALGYWLQINV